MRFSLTAVVVFVSSSSFGAVLFSQPNLSPDGFFSDSASYPPGVTFYQQAMADDFSLGTASTIHQIVFWGSSENVLTPGLGNFTHFHLQVYDASFSSLFSAFVPVAALTPTATGNLNGVGGQEHRFTYNTAITLGPGSYWLHVGAIYSNPVNDAFIWSSANGNGISSFKDLAIAGPWTPFPNGELDQAFELRGDVVPEPASMAALGLGALALLRRRRR